jgi:hypothetical protein
MKQGEIWMLRLPRVGDQYWKGKHLLHESRAGDARKKLREALHPDHGGAGRDSDLSSDPV